MSGEAYERFNEASPPVAPPPVICAACLQSARTWRPDDSGCQCTCHKDADAGTAAAVIDAANVPELIVTVAGPLGEAGVARLRERFAEVVRAQRLHVLADPERDSLTGRVAALAASLEASAKLTAPSRKSEIETALAKQLRELLSGGRDGA